MIFTFLKWRQLLFQCLINILQKNDEIVSEMLSFIYFIIGSFTLKLLYEVISLVISGHIFTNESENHCCDVLLIYTVLPTVLWIARGLREHNNKLYMKSLLFCAFYIQITYIIYITHNWAGNVFFFLSIYWLYDTVNSFIFKRQRIICIKYIYILYSFNNWSIYILNSCGYKIRQPIGIYVIL